MSLFTRLAHHLSSRLSAASALRHIAAVLAVCVLTMGAPAPAQANPLYASFVMDADTGQILHQRHADKPLHPASLVKIMTLTMLFDELAAGRLTLRDRIPVSKHAASMVPSKLNIPAGGSISVEDAIYALVTKSANDVAAAIGEKIGGTESQFAAMMTRRAREIGMTRTTYKNASGLHHKQQITTARDQAKLARYVIKYYPQYYRYFSTRDFSYRGQNYHNHNRLMSSYKGMDGMKTGYIAPSGFNLIASAVRNDRRLIGVVFGGRSAASRNAHMAQLLDRAFGPDSQPLLVAAAKADAIAPKPARKPEITQLAALYNSNNSFTLEQGDADPTLSRRLEKAMERESSATTGVQIASLSPATIIPVEQRPWAIQIGAFESRARTDAALRDTIRRLPDDLATAAPFIAPLKTGQGWLFRARLGGLSKEQAMQACKILKDCIPVAPQAF